METLVVVRAGIVRRGALHSLKNYFVIYTLYIRGDIGDLMFPLYSHKWLNSAIKYIIDVFVRVESLGAA